LRVRPFLTLSQVLSSQGLANSAFGFILAIRMLATRRAVEYTEREIFVGENKMTLEAMIENLSRDEKLAAMDLIWRDLAADSQSFVSPEWHGTIIADRLENPTSGPALPLAEAKAEIKDAIDARRASG